MSPMTCTRRAFTLVEVTVTMVMVGMSILIVGSLIPRALRSQEQNRYHVLAAAKVVDLMTNFNARPAIDFIDWEASAGAWDSPAGRVLTAPDIEAKCATAAFPLKPVPTVIARRLDSDRDEIQRLLDDGGYVYYCNASGSPIVEGHIASMSREPQEHRRLIVGVLGYPQQNHMGVFPWKAWPYYRNYPIPPVFRDPTEAKRPHKAGMSGTPHVFENVDRDVYYLWNMAAYLADPIGPTDLAPNGTTWLKDASRNIPIFYVANAYWLANRRGVATTSVWMQGTPASTTDIDADADKAIIVDSVGRLAHAAVTLTRYYTQAELAAGIDIPVLNPTGPAQLDPAALPGGTMFHLTLSMIRAMHENALRLAMAHGAAHPYDWGTFRPLNRAIMMDVPLVQWDLWSPLTTGQIAGTGSGAISAVTAEQWKPIAAKPMNDATLGPVTTPSGPVADGRSNIGANTPTLFPDAPPVPRNYFHPCAINSPIPKLSVAWGDTSHFTLTKPFSPSERCRQIVVWAVDWQSYEDFETAPSAAVDASRYPLAEPGQLFWSTFEQRMGRYTIPEFGDSAIMNDLSFYSRYQDTSRNPERSSAFAHPVAGMATGSDVSLIVCGPDYTDRHDQGMFDGSVNRGSEWGGASNRARDQGYAANRPGDDNPRSVFSGIWGADRNNNFKLDRGPLKASVRLRATTIVRYNVYDPRLPLTFR
jgi:hypothetical protein